MDQSVENRIRERAYEIWAAHGYVHGQADQHWLAAEREILAASTVACTFEDHQDPRSGQLTPHITRGNTSAQTPSARGSRNKSFLLARRTSQI